MAVDLERALVLLKICDLARQWPNHTPIHNLAMKELVDMRIEIEKEHEGLLAKAIPAKTFESTPVLEQKPSVEGELRRV